MNTDLVLVKVAKKEHRCSWCAEKIEAGESYTRYRYFGDDGASTVKLHAECLDATHELEQGDEFSPGDNPRGCACGHSRGCENCATIAAKRDAELSAVGQEGLNV